GGGGRLREGPRRLPGHGGYVAVDALGGEGDVACRRAGVARGGGLRAVRAARGGAARRTFRRGSGGERRPRARRGRVPRGGADGLARRGWLHRGAIADVGGVALLAALGIARGRSRDAGRAMRTTAPWAIAFAAYVAVAGGALASAYESGNMAPFVALGAALAP